MEKPWDGLYQSIVQDLKTVPVLETWEQHEFKDPPKLRQLPPHFLFRGEPILRDLHDEVYLAPEYDRYGFKLLEVLGVEVLKWEDIMPRLEKDWVSRKSRIKTKKRDSAWYEAFAELGMTVFKEGKDMQKRFKKKAVICLSGSNRWTGAPGMGYGGCKKIYFPITGGCPIPDDIGLDSADERASANAKVKNLYAALGVEECPKETVFNAIEASQKLSGGSVDLSSHLTYLFYHHDQPKKLRSWLHVPTDRGTKSGSRRIYFASTSAHDLDQLLSSKIRHWNGLKCSVIRAEFMEKNSSSAVLRIRERTWLTWLQEATYARYYPALTTKDKLHLSRDLEDVLKYNPIQFLPTMKADWDEYQHTASQINDQLRRCEVLCESGGSHPLESTYLPTSQVLETVQELGLSYSQMPILDLPVENLSNEQYLEWRFLEDFGVRPKSDLAFYQTALDELSQSKNVSLGLLQLLYKSMAALITYGDYKNLRLVMHLVNCVFR